MRSTSSSRPPAAPPSRPPFDPRDRRRRERRRRTRRLVVETLEPRALLASWSGDVPDGTVWSSSEMQRLTGNVRVPAGATLTIQPGTIVKANSFPAIRLLVEGTLIAQGTAGQPIVFTALRDDSGLDGVLGTADDQDTNGDGSTGGGRGDWGGITFGSGSVDSRLERFEVRWAGQGFGSSAVHVAGGVPRLSDGAIRGSGSAGMRIAGGAPVLRNLAFHNHADAAVRMALSANPEIVDSEFTGSPVNGVQLDAGALPADAVWDDPDVVYQLSGDVTVPAGRTLTIAAGQIVKSATIDGFVFSSHLLVDGTLRTLGTADRPVVFTSRRDDSVGGDTNNDGAGAPVAADWGMIRLSATSVGSVLDHLHVRYAGGFGATGGAVVTSSPDAVFRGGAVTASNAAGVRILAGRPELSDLTFSTNVGPAIRMALNADPLVRRVAFQGNSVNGVQVDSGTLAGDARWDDPDVVYQLSGDVTVPAGRTLTIAAGQIVKSATIDGFVFSNNLIVEGRLIADGTWARPVVLTSRRDDSAGGDTNNDGPSTGQPGDWGGIRFTSTSVDNRLDRVRIRFTGHSSSGSPPAIRVDGGSLTISDSLVGPSSRSGLTARNRAEVVVTNSEWYGHPQGAALRAESGASLTATNNTLDGNRQGAIATGVESVLDLTNNLVTFHSHSGVAAESGGVVRARYNGFHNPTATAGDFVGLPNLAGINGNFVADPRYVDRAARDFRLQADSPAIDAADSTGAPPNDLGFLWRLNVPEAPDVGAGDRPFFDVGAHEYGGRPRAVAHEPFGADDRAVDRVTFEFRQAIDPTSFSLVDDVESLTGPSGPLTPVDSRWKNPHELEIDFPEQFAAGDYVLTLGPQLRNGSDLPLDVDGDGLFGEPLDDRYLATWTVTPPRITAHTPEDYVGPAVDRVRLVFDRPMDATSFSLQDVERITGPNGPIALTGQAWIDARTLEIAFAPQSTFGFYELIVRPSIRSAAGDELDQDGDGRAGEPTSDRYFASFTIADVTRLSGAVTADRTLSGLVIVEDSTTVQAPATLTFLPGTIVKFFDQKSLTVSTGGTLSAEGDAARPIYFTSIHDDALAGDSDRNGDRTPPQPGAWIGLHLNGGTARLSHATLRYGGGSVTGTWNFSGMLRTTGAASLNVAASTLSDALFDGVLAQGGVTTIRDSVIRGADRGVVAWLSGARVDVTNATVDDNRIGLLAHGGTLTVVNSLITHNLSAGIDNDIAPPPVVRSSDFHNPAGVDVRGFASPLNANGNRSSNPRYRDSAAGDYRLTFQSPAIDAADGTAADDADRAGSPRYDDPRSPNVGSPLPGGAFADRGAWEFVEGAPSNVDLTVVSIAAPTSGSVGREFAVDVTVRNTGVEAAVGAWHDAVYLSLDAVWSPDDLLIGARLFSGEIGPNQSYSFTLAAPLPIALPGEYHVVVRPNSDLALFEGANAANNDRAALNRATIAWDLPELVLGVPYQGRFSPDDTTHYFRLNAPVGSALELLLDSAAVAGASELFLRRDALPAPAAYDAAHQAFNEPDQRLVLAETGPGTYYLRVDAAFGATRNAEYELLARAGEFGLTRATPNAGGNTGRVTVELAGLALPEGLSVELVPATGAPLPALRVVRRDATTVYATFDLTGAVPGLYGIRSTDEASRVAELDDAFTVRDGSSGGLRVQVLSPANVRPNRDGRVVIQYVNDGDVDAPAPLIGVTAAGADLKFAADASFAGPAVQFVGVDSAGLPSVLPPRSTHSLTLDFRPDPSGDAVVFTARAIPSTDDPANLDAYQAGLRPAGVDPAAWEAIWTNLLQSVGSTVRSLHDALRSDAEYLHELGDDTVDVGRLLQFKLQQASAAFPLESLVGAVDFAVPTPSGDLVWSRSFSHPLTGRYSLGTLGRGWSHAWDVRAIVETDGDVTIRGGGGERRFRRRADGSFRSEFGDPAVLSLVAGRLQLTEPSGRTFVFRTDGRPDYVEDAFGARITASYVDGRMTRLAHSAGPALEIAYDARGRIVSITDGVRLAAYEYDATGEHLIRAILPESTTNYTYDTSLEPARRHALTSVESTDGGRVEYGYDDQGRLARMAGRDDAEAVVLTYPGAGAVALHDPSGATMTFDFAPSRQVVRVRDAAGRVLRLNFDVAGRLTGLNGPAGLATSEQYDAAGRLLRSTDADGREWILTVDPATGRTTAAVDSRGERFEFTYDERGDLQAVVDSQGLSHEFTFDERGLLTSHRNARGLEVEYRYDEAGRTIEKIRPDGTRDTFSYDVAGRLASYSDPRGTTTLTHDSAGRLTRIEYPGGAFLNYQYDASGRRSRLEDHTGYVQQYAYDDQGRLRELTDGAGGRFVLYTYDDSGRLIEETKGNGTRTAYEFDSQGRLAVHRNFAPDGGVSSEFVYTYDALGRTVEVATLDGVSRYEYDDLGRTVAMTAPDGERREYRYDADGLLLEIVNSSGALEYVRDERGRVIGVGSASYDFDADGHVIARREGTETRTFEYDAEGRMSRSTGPEGTTVYEYDALGKLVARTVDGRRVEFVADPLQPEFPVTELPSDGTPVHYAVGHGLVSRTASPSNFYEFDPLGNTLAVTNTAGQPVNHYRYSPAGELESRTEAIPNPFETRGRYGGATRFESPGEQVSDDVLLSRMQNLSYRIDASSALQGGRPSPPDWSDMHPLDAALRGVTGATELFSYVGGHVMTSIAALGATSTFIDRGMVYSVDLGAYGNVTTVLNVPFQAMIYAIKFYNPDMDDLGRTFLDLASATASAGSYLLVAAGGGDPYAPGANYLRSTLQGLSTRFVPFAATRGILLRRVLTSAPVVGGVINAANVGWTAGRFLDELIQATDTGREQMELIFDFWCGALFLCASSEGTTALVRSFDPNEIIGPAGAGDEGWMRPGDEMPYEILFENKATAEAPAQDVFITSQLDADLDWSTFELEAAGFGSLTIPVPRGRQTYRTTVSTTNLDGSPLLVEFQAALDRQTGALNWEFLSLDPFTGEPPLDPFAGFLPPNDDSRRGEGFVRYRVRSPLSTDAGTTIEAQASIVFDTNAPIVTNTALNRLDVGSPVAHVLPLPAVSPVEFVVSWSGQDDASGEPGSGIDRYDVHVAVNDGPFERWLSGTTAVNAAFTGSPGSTYRFHAVAVDLVGRVETSAGEVEAETLVVDRPWQNSRNPLDVNDDLHVSPIDALLIINFLNSIGSQTLPLVRNPGEPYLDPSGDRVVAPVDALLVINHLNAGVVGEGEAATWLAPFATSKKSPDVSVVDLAWAELADDDLSLPPVARPDDTTRRRTRLRRR